MEKLNIAEILKLTENHIEILDDLLEQDEDVEVNSVNELIEKFNKYGKDQHSRTP